MFGTGRLKYEPDSKKVGCGIFHFNNLSPVSKFFLDAAQSAIRTNKNVILFNPYPNYNIFLLLAYWYTNEFRKSVYINLHENVTKELNEDYYLISSNVPAISRAPIGFLNEDYGFDVIPYVFRRAKGNKSDRKDKLKSYLESNTKARIVLDSSYGDRVPEFKTSFDTQDIGLIITEINSFYAEEDADRIAEWVHSRNNMFALKISHVVDENILDYFAKKINAIIIPIMPNVFASDNVLAKKSLKYYEDAVFPGRSNYFNIDKCETYRNESNNCVQVINNAPKTLDRLRKRLYDLSKKEIHFRDPELNTLTGAINNLSYKYVTSFVTPPLLNHTISISGSYITESGRGLVSYLRKRVLGLNSEQYKHCMDVIDVHDTIYKLINECKRYKTNYSFSNENKLYVLLNLLNEEIDCFNDILVVTTNNRERPALRTIIERHFPKSVFGNKIKVASQLETFWSQVDPDLVIFSGFLDKRYASMASRFRNSITLGYAARDANIAKEQIDHNKKVTLKSIEFYNTCMRTINEEIEIDKLAPYIDASGITNLGGPISDIDESELSGGSAEEIDEDWGVKISEFHERCTSERDLEYEESIRTNIVSKGTSFISAPESGEVVQIYATRLISGEKEVLELDKNNSYLFYDPSAKAGDYIQEYFIDEDKVGLNIIFLERNGRSAIIQLAKEVYGRDDMIDEQIIDIWKTEINNIDLIHGDRKRLHRQFKELGGKVTYTSFNGWLKGEVIAPKDPEDLRLLGETINSKNIIENYENISDEANELRSLNRNMGRQINKVIKSIMKGKDTNSLSPELEDMTSVIRNRIFRVDGIRGV